jgi:hypothetical protein
MIKIASAGRSGSAWLCNILSGAGLSVVHEWFPYNVTKPDAVADTTWLYSAEEFWGSLSPNDAVIVLDREQPGRLASINKLLGSHDWTVLNKRWHEFLNKAIYSDHRHIHHFNYENLFDLHTRDQLRHILFQQGHSDAGLDRHWNFSVSMRITNQRSELDVRRALGLV